LILAKKGKLELTWVGKDERAKLEQRALVTDPADDIIMAGYDFSFVLGNSINIISI